jgi:hypothetical protein
MTILFGVLLPWGRLSPLPLLCIGNGPLTTDLGEDISCVNVIVIDKIGGKAAKLRCKRKKEDNSGSVYQRYLTDASSGVA